MLVANSSKLDILFCVMPFSPCNSPNLGVSILKSLVTDLGISAENCIIMLIICPKSELEFMTRSVEKMAF